jgi:hypothetical protein
MVCQESFGPGKEVGRKERRKEVSNELSTIIYQKIEILKDF